MFCSCNPYKIAINRNCIPDDLLSVAEVIHQHWLSFLVHEVILIQFPSLSTYLPLSIVWYEFGIFFYYFATNL